MKTFLIMVGLAITAISAAALMVFLDLYFTGGGLETKGEPLRKKWSKTHRMKKFLGVAEYDKNKRG